MRTDRDMLAHSLKELYQITGWDKNYEYLTVEKRRQKLLELIMEIETHLGIMEEGER